MKIIFGIFVYAMTFNDVQVTAVDAIYNNTCSIKELVFQRILNTKLDLSFKFILLTETVNQPEDCFGTCQYLQACHSFNAIQISEKQIQCQFLNLDRYQVPKQRIMNTSESSYFEIIKISSCYMNRPKDCVEIYEQSVHENGEYTISMKGKYYQVLCDMNTGPFGYTIFQKRWNGEESFNRSWIEYKNGFGSFKMISGLVMN